MDLSALRGIPHPTEYEDPFIASANALFDFLDAALEYRYSPIPAVATATDTLAITITAGTDRVLRAGLPVRYRAEDYAPWRYGVIATLDPRYAAPPGELSLAGAPTQSLSVDQVEVGGAAQLVHRHCYHPGSVNGSDTDALFSDPVGRGEVCVWDGPPAYLVQYRARLGVPDSTGDVYVCPTINRTGLEHPAWERVDTKHGGDGLLLFNTAIAVSEATLDPAHYRVMAGDVIDVAIRTSGGTHDAQNLTIEYTFALAGDQDQYCYGNAPQVLCTITGLAPGQQWQGLGDGVHLLCPTTYQALQASWYVSASSYALSHLEYWVRSTGGTPADLLMLSAATFNREPGGLHTMYSYAQVMLDSVADDVSYTSLIYGYIRDRLFQTFTIGGATFTLQRGLGPWVAP